MAGVDQLVHTGRSDGDAVLVVLDLPRDPDSHESPLCSTPAALPARMLPRRRLGARPTPPPPCEECRARSATIVLLVRWERRHPTTEEFPCAHAVLATACCWPASARLPPPRPPRWRPWSTGSRSRPHSARRWLSVAMTRASPVSTWLPTGRCTSTLRWACCRTS